MPLLMETLQRLSPFDVSSVCQPSFLENFILLLLVFFFFLKHCMKSFFGNQVVVVVTVSLTFIHLPSFLTSRFPSLHSLPLQHFALQSTVYP